VAVDQDDDNNVRVIVSMIKPIQGHVSGNMAKKLGSVVRNFVQSSCLQRIRHALRQSVPI